MNAGRNWVSLASLLVATGTVWVQSPLSQAGQCDPLPGLFPSALGEYVGLIRQTNGTPGDRAGFFSFTINSKGCVNGKLILGRYAGDLSYPIVDEPIVTEGVVRGWRYQFWLFAGNLWDGTFRQEMTAEVQLDFATGTNLVRGTLSDAHEHRGVVVPATWSAELAGQQAAVYVRTNPAPTAGAYTLVFPGGDGVNEPAGAGFATVNVDAGGHVRLEGFLADGAHITQRTSISKDGQWPLFARLYSGKGAVSGWLFFPSLPGDAVNGTVSWTKPPLPAAQAYAAGFANSLEVAASRYWRPTGRTSGWNFTNGVAVFSGGSLAAPLTNTFLVSSSGKITCSPPNRLSLKLVSALGLFQGTVKPAAGKSYTFKGALLQDRDCGYGYFIDEHKLSGLVFVGPES